MVALRTPAAVVDAKAAEPALLAEADAEAPNEASEVEAYAPGPGVYSPAAAAMRVRGDESARIS